MKALISELKPQEYRYDVVVGVSIGSLNTALFSTFEKGNEAEAVAYLEDIWTNTDSQDLWNWWPYLNIAGGLWYRSFLDSSPLHVKAANWLANRSLKRKVGMQAVDINTGKIVMFDETVP